MEQRDVETKDLNNLESGKPVLLFGKDIREIKCFRKSFISGICCGVVGGLATFLFTSKALFSTNIAVATLWIGVLGYWIPCRYKFETEKLMYDQIKLQTSPTVYLEKVSESETRAS